jgi:serine protease DegQ
MRKTWLIFSQAVTVALAVLFVVATLKPDWIKGGAGPVVAPGLPAIVSIAPAPVGSAASAPVALVAEL